MKALASHRARSLTGTTRVSGDKSISHRALILGALAIGKTEITGISRGEDVAATEAALRQLGTEILADSPTSRTVFGCGVGGFHEPSSVLDLGNSGTGARLLMGAVATQDIVTHFTGDASLSMRPMKRVVVPLERMGAEISTRDDGLLPLMVRGAATPVPIDYELPVASAQVKSAVLLAALNTTGRTTVIEPAPTRDHTERMLSYFDATVSIDDAANGGRKITIEGQPELTGRPISVPGDPSSAAFLLAAALMIPESDITVENVNINPLRTGFLDTVRDMGAEVQLSRNRTECGEPVADVCIRHVGLSGIEVPPERAPTMIDEYPVLGALASVAQGTTVMRGVRELRVKESDRISAMVVGLQRCGVTVEEFDDGFTVRGSGGSIAGGADISSDLDHRIAMSFLLLGMAAENPITVSDAQTIDTSFPEFVEIMNELGAEIHTSAVATE
ncbi:MAG: 3-phosphoshikimate 1-carboxyvinyltransferase [Alphaproteobacteria bacterium]|nr:3-phosphoshikimate 1-carboxyvinyltransferase [Alphaproteobacteria bacterium]